MSSSSDNEDYTLKERQENAVIAYNRLGHRELLRESSRGFKQVCDELEAIFRNEGVWICASKKFQHCVADVAAAAIAVAAASPAAEQTKKLDLISRTVIRAMAQNKNFQRKYRTGLSNTFRDAAIMSRRRRKQSGDSRGDLPWLPPEVLAIIFGLLQSPIDLACCRAVCTHWRDVCDSFSDVLWARHLQVMIGSKDASAFLSHTISANHSRRQREPSAEMRLINSLIHANGHILDPFKYGRFIVETRSDAGYFLRQMNEATFQRLLRTSEDKGMYARRCFVSPAEVATYIARPVPSTLMQLVQMASLRPVELGNFRKTSQ